MKKKALLVLLVLAIGAVSLYFYVYKEHRNIAAETADFSLTVAGLQKGFQANDSLATQKYQDKTIQVSGRVSQVDAANKSITIDGKLFATFTQNPSGLSEGKAIKIKGRFLGYDELLEEFKMDQTTVVE